MGMLDNRVAVITGAGRGIGAAIAMRFVAEGAAVCINDVDETPAAETVAAIEKTGGKAIAAVGSVAEEAFCQEMMGKTDETFGAVDILINNAGITRDNLVHKMPVDDFRFVLDVNLTGTFNCIKACAPYMRDRAKAELERDGTYAYHRKIVNFYSTAAIRGNIGQASYTAAKMGNIGLTRTIAQEWGKFGVCVNAVGPGFTDTRLTQVKTEETGGLGIPAKIRDAAIARIPFGRPASPDDIANVCLFFSSPLSDFVTGQQINVSGGYLINAI